MRAISKNEVFEKNENKLLFIKNKEYNCIEIPPIINNDFEPHMRIVSESGYTFTLRLDTFYDLFYSVKEYRKLKLKNLENV